jgi:Pyruvate/2-oxoacid:ferredoxin oxidoreductase delta subunit
MWSLFSITTLALAPAADPCTNHFLVVATARRKPATALAGPRMASQGLAEAPLTCHPGIDTHTCIGSSACVGAYPEHAIRLVSGTTGLVDQDHSIGPDACEAACPIEAIQPGFRTENCGIDLPFGTPTIATNAPGIFLAGELACLNGADLHEERSRNRGDRVHPGENGSANKLDVVIVGAELVGCDPQQSDGAVFLVS